MAENHSAKRQPAAESRWLGRAESIAMRKPVNALLRSPGPGFALGIILGVTASERPSNDQRSNKAWEDVGLFFSNGPGETSYNQAPRRRRRAELESLAGVDSTTREKRGSPVSRAARLRWRANHLGRSYLSANSMHATTSSCARS